MMSGAGCDLARSPGMTPHAADRRRATLIVNVHSRQGQALFGQACQKLEQAGIQLITAQAEEDPAKIAPSVAAAIEQGSPLVIVGGGDGTLASVIGAFAGRDCVFGVLPFGTANSLARSLDIPLDLDGAVAVIRDGAVRRIDMVSVNGAHFANSACIGLAPTIATTVPAQVKRYFGRLGYGIWALRCLFTFRPFRLTIASGKETKRLWATEVRILNGGFHAGVQLSDTAAVDSGEVVIQAVAGRSLLNLVKDWYLRFFRMDTSATQVLEMRGRQFRIETRPRRSISIDGEVRTKTPAMVEVVRACVQVMVPAPDEREPQTAAAT
jgi:YegS/Rv2252/BmrU family lipid kinase